MSTTPPSYPWYAEVTGDEIEQGDIFEACTVFIPPDAFVTEGENAADKATFKWEKRDVIVMSQSCDLAKGREKLTEVLLCPLWTRSQLSKVSSPLASDKGMEEARRGNLPGYHVISNSTVNDFEREVRVVDFRRVYSLPIGFVRKHAENGKRLRLMPPYREHLSQAFARFFMRVGLPSDIPSFYQKK